MGSATDASDIDVAIMFEKVPNFYGLSDLQVQLSSHVGKEVDNVVLNAASPVLRKQVLKYGLLIKKDTRTYIVFMLIS